MIINNRYQRVLYFLILFIVWTPNVIGQEQTTTNFWSPDQPTEIQVEKAIDEILNEYNCQYFVNTTVLTIKTVGMLDLVGNISHCLLYLVFNDMRTDIFDPVQVSRQFISKITFLKQF